MSVIIDTNYFRRPFRGFDDPSLPEGYWVASSSVTGDGSGGIREVRVKLQEVDQPLSGNMFSLEQLVLTEDEEDGAGPFIVRTTNMDTMGGLAGQYSSVGALAAGAAAVVGRAIVNTSAIGTRATWIGAPFAAGLATLGFAVDNITGNLYGVFAQGYIWGPRSILAPGGPQRPAQGLYAN